ncbi:MAG TPA: hypothetical protein VGD60_10185 [Candidatus Acidoferrales bacterium]
MPKRTQTYLLGALLLVLAYFTYSFVFPKDPSAGLPGVLAAETKFTPINVDEPQLRIDLLEKLKRDDYEGAHRNIFSFGPPPPPPMTKAEKERLEHKTYGPQVPPPPAPVNVGATLFGFASMPQSGKRVAFFLDGEDVLVVTEGAVFLNRFRLDKIGNDSADVEEISSQRHVTVQMVAPASAGGGAGAVGGDNSQPNPGPGL